MTNIDDFNRGVTLIMSLLYCNFPEPITINVSTIDTYEDISGDETRIRKRVDIYMHTVNFLADEGYVRNNEDRRTVPVFNKAVLTSKGLAALNKSPKMLNENRKSMGDILQDLSKDALKGMAGDLFKAAVQGLLS